MDAAVVLQQVFTVQRAFEALALLALTAYLFPQQAPIYDNQDYDFIVVGAGSAGTVVAYRLAECNFNVLLIEAGGEPPITSVLPGLFPYLSHSESDWNYTNIQVDNLFQCYRAQTVNLTIGHVLGGGSSINYMLYVRGCPGDFTAWAEAANDSSWNYEGMLPYFIKSERLEDKEVLTSRYRRYHGTRGFLGVTRDTNPRTRPYLEAFRELGHPTVLDINGDNSIGYTQQMFTIAEGVRQSTAYSIFTKYKSSNLKVLKHTFVSKILFDGTNNAIGVKAITEDNKEITIRARKEVIVSAGSLNTARLLMVSGIGPAEHLKSLGIPVRKNLPVGQNLQDHVPVIMSFQLDPSDAPLPSLDPHQFPFPAFTGYVALNRTQKCPTYQAINYLVPAGSKFPLELCIFNYGFKSDICQRLYEGGKTRNTMFITLSLLHPKSFGQVTLRSSDPQDPPLVNVAYFNNSEDLDTLAESLMDFSKVLNTTFFRSMNSEMVDLKLQMCEGLKYMSLDYWRCYARCMMITLYHYIGTCRLGSVVDSKLRVFGIGKLRIIDASVMPREVSANINPAVIAIGEKGADIVRKEYYCSTESSSKLFNTNFWGF